MKLNFNPPLLLILGVLSLQLFSANKAQANSVLNVYTEEYPPFNFKDKNGQPAGQSTLIVETALKSLGIDYRIKFVPWARALKFAADSKDSCVYSTSRTPEREATYQWLGPLVENPWTMFTLKSNKAAPKKLSDIEKETIGTYLGDAIVDYLQNKDIAVLAAANDEVNISKLKSGRVKYWATGRLNGQSLLEKSNETSIVPIFDFNKTQMYLACNKKMNPEVAAKIDVAIKAAVEQKDLRLPKQGSIDR